MWQSAKPMMEIIEVCRSIVSWNYHTELVSYEGLPLTSKIVLEINPSLPRSWCLELDFEELHEMYGSGAFSFYCSESEQ